VICKYKAGARWETRCHLAGEQGALGVDGQQHRGAPTSRRTLCEEFKKAGKGRGIRQGNARGKPVNRQNPSLHLLDSSDRQGASMKEREYPQARVDCLTRKFGDEILVYDRERNVGALPEFDGGPRRGNFADGKHSASELAKKL